jgi:protein ImuA
MLASKKDIISQLQKEILPLQGFRPPSPGNAVDMGLGPVEAAFPNGVFPTGAMHEFLNDRAEDAAASGGMMAGLLAGLMQKGGVCVWIGCRRTLFPPALKAYGIEPDRVIFVDLKREKDVLWAMEEALKCEGLAAVVGEMGEIDFTASRRLQLAVEKSRVTGFILRRDARKMNVVASVARWKVSSLESHLEDGLPGVGFPRWRVELDKIRNGRPGAWVVEWSAGMFRVIPEMGVGSSNPERIPLPAQEKRKTG